MYIRNVLEYLDNSASMMPHKIGIIDKTEKIDFNTIRKTARTIGSYVADNIDCRNKPIVIFVSKGSKCVISFFATTYSGNVYVPIDVNQPIPRIKAILSVLNPACVITEKSLFMRASEAISQDKIIVYEDILCHSINDTKLDMIRARTIDTDPLYLIFTSGSTGVPKGVTINHRSVIDYIEWVKVTYNIEHTDVIGNQAPFYFDNSVLDLYSFIKNGATLNIIPETLFTFPMRLVEYLIINAITTIFWVPSVIISVANSGVLSSNAPKALSKILFAGEVMPVKQLNVWRKNIPNALYSNLYGPTEITVDCTYYIVDREFNDDEPLPIGYPCRNTDILLIKDDKTLAKQGEHGEICVRGSSLALGYYNNEEKTAAAFVQNPLNNHYPELIYKTGDLAYLNERGEIMFIGRKDFQIKHMGYRLELGEIEHLASAVDGIKHVCILYNKDKKEITMFYEASCELSAGVIRTELGKVLPKYALPTVFYILDELPRNPNGKIDRQELTKKMIGDK